MFNPFKKNFSLKGAVALYQADRLYRNRFRRFGAHHSGVHWNSSDEQKLRFNLLCSAINSRLKNPKLSIADLGCGYGLLYSYLQDRGFIGTYYGYERCSNMLSYARKQFPYSNAHFIHASSVQHLVDYTLISGCFNLKMNAPTDLWWEWVKQLIEESWSYSKSGLAFNLLMESRSKNPLSKLFYTSHHKVISFCKTLTQDIECLPSNNLPDAHFILRRSTDDALVRSP